MEDTAPAAVQRYLLELVDATLEDLAQAGCLEIEDDFLLRPTVLGHVASYYYLVRCRVLCVLCDGGGVCGEYAFRVGVTNQHKPTHRFVTYTPTPTRRRTTARWGASARR